MQYHSFNIFYYYINLSLSNNHLSLIIFCANGSIKFQKFKQVSSQATFNTFQLFSLLDQHQLSRNKFHSRRYITFFYLNWRCYLLISKISNNINEFHFSDNRDQSFQAMNSTNKNKTKNSLKKLSKKQRRQKTMYIYFSIFIFQIIAFEATFFSNFCLHCLEMSRKKQLLRKVGSRSIKCQLNVKYRKYHLIFICKVQMHWVL
jgi:hypothetical protein